MNAFVTNERKSLTPQQKARLFLERGGKCHRCGRKLRSGDKWTDEHVIALQNAGTNVWDNRDITCDWCFKPKNAEDAKKAAKGRRVAVQTYVPRRERLSKKPMPCGKNSPWKMKMDRTIVPRFSPEVHND